MIPVAVIFDFDGVLADTLETHLKAWVLATKEVFQQDIAPPTELSGHSTKTIAHLISKSLGQPSMATALASTKERLVTKVAGPVSLYPGVKVAINQLRARSIPFAIGSNASRAFVTAALADHQIEVATIVTASDVSRHKPAPDIFWACGNQMNISPANRERILVFEDSPHGIEAAVAAKMFPIGVTTALDTTQLRRAGAKLTVSSVAAASEAGWFSSINESH
ncbi:MAG: HAD family phosphatase [Deltaproteobacteria bacterium]|nr:HAD family phosphatase [Deltaproteobacteria bacterium]